MGDAKPLHFNVKVIGRSPKRGKQSVVAAAAYRAGEAIYDERAKKTHDYTRKKGVEHTEIFAPEYAPEWVKEREKLWNAIEAAETRINAQLARSVILCLPRQLTLEQNKALLREFIAEHFTANGMVSDLAIHASETNPHAHVLLTMRNVTSTGIGGKNRDWNKWDEKKGKAESVSPWRVAFEELCNQHLERAGRSERITLSSNEERGIDKEPTKHMERNDWQKEEKGEETNVGAHNRAVKHRNRMRQIRQERKQLAERELLDTLVLYQEEETLPKNLQQVAKSTSESDGTNLRDTVNNMSGTSGAQQRKPDEQTSPATVGHSLVTDDPAMQQAYQRQREAVQRAYRHRHIGTIMRATVRNRVTHWKEQVIGRSQEVLGHLAKLWKHSRDAHGHLRKERNRGYER